MNLNTDQLKRGIRTLQSSLELYTRAEAESVEREVFRNAIVKGFELTPETAFKLLKKALKEFGHGREGSIRHRSRSCCASVPLTA